MFLGIKATTEEVIVGNRNVVLLTRTVGRKTARERWKRSNLELIVAVPWRKNEYDAKMDGERLKGEVVMMDKDYNEKLEITCSGAKECVHNTLRVGGVRIHSQMSHVHVT